MAYQIFIHNGLTAPLRALHDNTPLVGVGQSTRVGHAENSEEAWNFVRDYAWEILARYPVFMQRTPNGCRLVDSRGHSVALVIAQGIPTPIAA